MFSSAVPATVTAALRGNAGAPLHAALSAAAPQVVIVTFVRAGVEKATLAVRAIDRLLASCAAAAASEGGVAESKSDGGAVASPREGLPGLQLVLDIGEGDWCLPDDLTAGAPAGTAGGSASGVTGVVSGTDVATRGAVLRWQHAAGLSVAAIVPEVAVFDFATGEPLLVPADRWILSGALKATLRPLAEWPRNCFPTVQQPGHVSASPARRHAAVLHPDALLRAVLYSGDPVMLRRVGAAAADRAAAGSAPLPSAAAAWPAVGDLHSVPAVANPPLDDSDDDGADGGREGGEAGPAPPASPPDGVMWLSPGLLASLGLPPAGATVAITASDYDDPDANVTPAGRGAAAAPPPRSVSLQAVAGAAGVDAGAVRGSVRHYLGVSVDSTAAAPSPASSSSSVGDAAAAAAERVRAAAAAAGVELTADQLATLVAQVGRSASTGGGGGGSDDEGANEGGSGGWRGACARVPLVTGQVFPAPLPSAAGGGEVWLRVTATQPRHRVVVVEGGVAVAVGV
jgi:hypothetical protein